MIEQYMSFEDYRAEVIRLLEKHIADQKYLEALEADIKKHYDEELDISEIIGENQVSPGGYALGILFMYPDLP